MKSNIIYSFLLVFFLGCLSSTEHSRPRIPLTHVNSDTIKVKDSSRCSIKAIPKSIFDGLVKNSQTWEGAIVTNTSILNFISELFRDRYDSIAFYHSSKLSNDNLLFTLIGYKNLNSKYLMAITIGDSCINDTLSITHRCKPCSKDDFFSQLWFYNRKEGLYIEFSLHETKHDINRIYHPDELKKTGQLFFNLSKQKFDKIDFLPNQ
jgi:hypothetical protein